VRPSVKGDSRMKMNNYIVTISETGSESERCELVFKAKEEEEEEGSVYKHATPFLSMLVKDTSFFRRHTNERISNCSVLGSCWVLASLSELA
jgi:hypothetical protein